MSGYDYRSVKASEDATEAILRDPSGYDPIVHGPPYMPTKTAESKEVVHGLLRQVGKGAGSRVAKVVQANLDAFAEEDFGELGALLVFLRALAVMHQSAHWATSGAQSYSNHQLFDRVYGATFNEIDLVGERSVGLGGVALVEPVRLSAQTIVLVAELASVSPPPFGKALVEVSLVAELRFLLLLQAMIRSLRDGGKLTPGTDNLLAGVADTHEGHVYLLRQSLPLRIAVRSQINGPEMKKRTQMPKTGVQLGAGLDLGTMNIVSARKSPTGVVTMRVRDAFIDLEIDAKKSLKMSKIDYVEKDGQLIVIGDSALKMANLFKREARRPLSRGVISAGEHDAQEILSLMAFQVLKEPEVDGEHCYYSVPAAPIDDQDQDVTYHQEIFRKILSEHGYTAHPMNEAMAIIYSQCAEESFSGLSISFGSGMCNVALGYETVEGFSFSVARGGDWIDTHAAKAMGSTSARMCTIKEKGVNLLKPETRDEEAITLYIRSLIRYCLENIVVQFKKNHGKIDLPNAIPLVVSGGTTLAGGFMEVFREEFDAAKKKGFPIEISEIRRAKDPMTAVAEGLLVLAMQEHD